LFAFFKTQSNFASSLAQWFSNGSTRDHWVREGVPGAARIVEVSS